MQPNSEPNTSQIMQLFNISFFLHSFIIINENIKRKQELWSRRDFIFQFFFHFHDLWLTTIMNEIKEEENIKDIVCLRERNIKNEKKKKNRNYF